MAIRQYIGARYVPRFLGTWDATQQYEGMDVVDNGLGTSYIATKTVPVGTPLTNTDFWAVYGASSGAVINLQNQIDDINTEIGGLHDDISDTNGRITALDTAIDTRIDGIDTEIDGIDSSISTIQGQISGINTNITNLQKRPTKKKWVLIGDSFGVGIIDSSTPWTTGWEDYFSGLFPGRVFYFDAQHDPGFAGAGAFTTTGQYTFIDQLQYIHDSLLGTTPDTEITDVVVLGGSNEIGSVNDIISQISAFCTRSRTLFPNAEITLGCVGLHARKIVNIGAFKGYSTGAGRNGCRFLKDLLNMGASRTYDSGLGHWTAAGYAVFNPIIAKCIMTGCCNFRFVEEISLTVNSDITVPGSVTFKMELIRTEHGIFGHILNNTDWQGWWFRNAKTLATGVHTVTAFKFTGGFYAAVLSGASIDPAAACFKWSTGEFDNFAVKISLVLETNGVNNHEIRFTTFRRLSYSSNDDLAFTWNGSFNNKLEDSIAAD